MASADKLWFELGVRDGVSKVLNDLIGKAVDLRRAMVLSDKDLGFGKAQKNALDLEKALVDVSTTLNKIRAQKGQLVDPEEIKTAEKMERKFKQMLTALNKLQREIKNKLKTEGLNAIEDLNINGLVQNILNEKGFSLAQSQANKFLSDNAKKMNDASQAAIGLANAYDKVSESGKRTNTMLNQIRNQLASTLSLYAFEGLIKNIIQIGGEFEVQRIALENILGDAQKANELYTQLKSLAIESPFSFRQQVTFSKQLSAYGIPYNELYDTTKRLADMSAGLGVDMNRLILAYGQVRSAAVLRGQELRQFTEAGIPIVQALADEFTKLNGKVVTTGEVFKLISQRAVPFEMVKKILWEMTDEGGRFYNMQYELADTLAGKWSNLRDAWEIMLSEFAAGESTGGKTMKFLVSLTTELIKGMRTLSPLIYGAMGGFGIMKSFSLINSLYNGGFNNVTKNLAAAQRLNAIEINRRHILGEINKAERDRLLLQNANTKEAMGQLAISGRLSSMQMFQAYNNKVRGNTERLITQEYVKQAYELGIINEKEMEAILNGNRRMMFQQRITKALNIGFTGWATVAIAAGLGVYQAYSSWASSIEEQVKNAAEGARNRSKEFGKNIDVYEATGTPSDKAELSARVNAMKQLLETNDLYTEGIKNQVDYAKDLTAQYEILLKALKNAKGQAEWLVSHKSEIEAGIRASSTTFGGWDWAKLGTFGLWDIATGDNSWDRFFDYFFDDDINENLGQYDEALAKLNNIKTVINSYKDEYTAAIETMKEKYGTFADAVKDKSPEQALMYIAQNDTWLKVFEENLSEGDKFLAKTVKTMGDHAEDVSSRMQEMIKNDSYKMFESIAANMGMNLETYKKYCKEHESYTRDMITSIVASLEKGGAAAKYNLAKALLEFFGLASKEAGKIVQDSKSLPYRQQTDEGKHVLGKLISGAKDKGWGNQGQGVWNVQWINKFFKQDASYVSGLNAMRQAWLEAKENREAAAKSGARLSAKDEAEWQRLDRAADIYDFKDRKSKLFGGGKSGKNGTDEELKEWREELKELQEFWREYERLSKRMNDSQAIEEIRKSGVFPSLFDGDKFKYDVKKGLSNALDNLLAKTNDATVERETLQIDIKKTKFNVDQKAADEAADALLKQLDDELKKQGKQWDLYKKILDATGNKEQAAQFAFGRSTRFENYAEQLRSEISDALQKNDKAKNKTIDELLGLDDNALKEIGIFEKGIDGVYKKLKQLKDVEESLNATNTDLWLKAITNAKELDTQIALINQKYDDMRKALEKNRTAQNSEQTDKALQGLDKANREEVAKATWDNFKATEEWGRIFSNLDNITTDTLSYMLDKLREVAPSIRDSVEATKALYEAMDKIQDQLYDRNPFAALGDYFKKMSAFREAAAGLKGSKGTDKIHFTEETAQKMGLTTNGKGWTGTVQEFNDAMYKESKGFSKIVSGIGKTFKALQDVLQPVIDLFDQLGMTELSTIFQMGNNAFGAAASAASGISSLGGLFNKDSGIGKALGDAGPYAAAAAAGISIVSGLFALHDKALQEEIDASKARQKEMENLTKNLQTSLEYVLGGVYTFTSSMMSKKQREDFLRQANQITGKGVGSDWLSKLFYELTKGRYGDDTVANMGKAARTQEYYDMQRAGMMAQRDELRKQLAAESDKKDSDSNAIADYKQQIKEIETELNNFALDMAKTLYDIDLKSWAQELTDAIVEAWENGEDAAEAYKDKVKEIMKDLTKNILAQKIMEKAFENAGIDDLISQMMDAQSGKLDETNVGRIAEALYNVGETSSNAILAILDEMEKKGYINKGDDSASTSTSAGIKSITENTADLICSYLQAIRADVSVNRATLDQILVAVQTGARVPVIAEAQLRELQTLVSMARERTQFVGEIRDMISRAQNGTMPISVK